MSSLNALKYKVSVTPSYHAGAVMFLLYSFVTLITLTVTTFTTLSGLIYLLLFCIVFYVAREAYLSCDEIKLSESGLVERQLEGKRYYGVISGKSFYNTWLIVLKLEVKDNLFSEKSMKQLMFIYKDAISEEHFRLLAQVINNRRH
jgi:hypothetical protein